MTRTTNQSRATATPLIEILRTLSRRVERLRFGPPVACVYNPLDYARAAHEQYLARFGRPPREIILLGMNPGPWGMAQTGVPFGEVAAVRDWLRIDAAIGRPPHEHPARPVRGLQCPRSEVSGARLWGWARETFTSPERFFARFFVANYCPLAFLESSGRNLTPDKLPTAERAPLLAACDDALRAVVDCLRPRILIGIGAFAEQRARTALADCDLLIGRMPHPSPASPAANRDWPAQAAAALRSFGISMPCA